MIRDIINGSKVEEPQDIITPTQAPEKEKVPAQSPEVTDEAESRIKNELDSLDDELGKDVEQKRTAERKLAEVKEERAKEQWDNIKTIELAKKKLNDVWAQRSWVFADRPDYYSTAKEYPEEKREILTKRDKQESIKKIVEEEARNFYQNIIADWLNSLKLKLEGMSVTYTHRIEKLYAMTDAFVNGFKEDETEIDRVFDELLSPTKKRVDVFDCIQAQTEGKIAALCARTIKDAPPTSVAYKHRLAGLFDLMAAIKSMQDPATERQFAIVPAKVGEWNIIDALKYLNGNYTIGNRVNIGLISTNTCVDDKGSLIPLTKYKTEQMQAKELAINSKRKESVKEHLDLLTRLKVSLSAVHEADKYNKYKRGDFVIDLDQFIADNWCKISHDEYEQLFQSRVNRKGGPDDFNRQVEKELADKKAKEQQQELQAQQERQKREEAEKIKVEVRKKWLSMYEEAKKRMLSELIKNKSSAERRKIFGIGKKVQTEKWQRQTQDELAEIDNSFKGLIDSLRETVSGFEDISVSFKDIFHFIENILTISVLDMLKGYQHTDSETIKKIIDAFAQKDALKDVLEPKV